MLTSLFYFTTYSHDGTLIQQILFPQEFQCLHKICMCHSKFTVRKFSGDLHALLPSLIKEINTYVNHLLLRKIDVLKTSILSERKFEEMHYVWRVKRCKRYSRKRLFWHYRLQPLFIYKTMSQICLNLFWSRDKRLLSEFLRKLGWHGHNERFPKYLGKKLKCQKTETVF